MPAPDSRSDRRLRVLTTRHYGMPFNLPRGSRHELIEEKFYDPWRRIFDWTEAIAVWDPRLRMDLVHSYNKIPFTSKPWLVTFEDQLPRLFGKNPIGMKERLRERLLRPNCKAIIPISDYARNMFCLHHQDSPKLAQLLEKTQVIYPNVPILDSEAKSYDGGVLNLAFVGNAFARKGGLVALRAAKIAQERGLPVHFHLVSSLQVGATIYTDSAETGVYDADLKLLDLPNVTRYGNLPNSEVMDLLRRSHFHILPTLDDSFGFSVIESLSAATPVIASNVCALTESVQDGVNGYSLQLPLDEYRKWTGVQSRDWRRIDEASSSLTEQMVERLEKIVNSPADYAAMSASALEGARAKFAAETHRELLDNLYSRAAG